MYPHHKNSFLESLFPRSRAPRISGIGASLRAGALLCFWTLGAALGLAGAGHAASAPTLAAFPLHPFSATDSQYANADGAYPVAALTAGANGTLYGVTVGGGASGAGTLFKVQPDGIGFTVLHSLDPDADGAGPTGTLLIGVDGYLYGTTSDRGPSGSGTVFKVRADGTGFTVLHAFDPDVYHGGSPSAGLTDGGDGFLYGTTSGGASGAGMVFRIAPDGSGFTNLHLFYGGDAPLGALTVSAGFLYGTTYSGGDNGMGSVFAIHPDGTGYAVLYSFTGGADGGYPQAGLTRGSDGFFYGTASDSQTYNGYGSVFKIAPDGSGFATLHTFTDGADGGSPFAPVTLGADGMLYGTTFGGGANGAGTVFAVNPDGTGFTTVASLSGTGGDGGGSCAALTPGPQGQWYGTAYDGGTSGDGALFTLASAHAHVMWTRPDRSISVWDMSDPDPAATAHVYGPYWDWTAKSLVDGLDGKTRIQWEHFDGACCIWTLDAQNNINSTPVFGAFADWAAAGIAVGSDGQSHIQWKRTDGACCIWTLDAQNNINSTPVFGAFADWAAAGIAVGSDGQSHIQWNRSDGTCQVWTVDAQNAVSGTPAFGPFNGWTAAGIAVGSDGQTRLQWNRSDGACQVWTVDAQNNITNTPTFGPGAGWAAAGLTVGPDGATQVHWNRAGNTCQIWTLNSGGSYSTTPLYIAPFNWNTQAAVN